MTSLDRTFSLAALLVPGFLSRPLRQVRAEFQARLDLAFRLATTHGRAVSLEPSRRARSGQVAVRLPQGVRWGCPDAIPLPPGLEETAWGGGRPHPITVMPEGRAAANVWFVHHGRQVLCLSLGLGGAVHLFRYRPLLGAWVRC